MQPVVAVYGSATPKPGQADYEAARRLGMLLAQAGYVVMTGGYGGTMEAVSRGAAEVGGHTIGVTCAEIERYRPLGPNPWVREVVPTATLLDRLRTLTERSMAAVALPGGVGTLLEITLSWNLLVIGAIPPRPLILVGKNWQSTFEGLFATHRKYIPQHARHLLTFASNVKMAAAMLNAIHPGNP